MYQIFFREFVASQRAADQRRDKGEDDTALRNLFQRAFGLDSFEHQMLTSAAQACLAAQEANVRATQQLAQRLELTPDNAALKAPLGQLQRASEAAVNEGVQQLRPSLIPQRFQRLDLMIRVHVVPNLRMRPAPEGVKKSPGGN